MEQDRPNHASFGNFINEVISPSKDKIFHMITKAIVDEIGLDTDDAFIDGSKFEADANKYKFVWKPTKLHEKLSDKIRVLLDETELSRGIREKGIIESRSIAAKISEMSKLIDEGKPLVRQYSLLCEYLNKSLEYEEKEMICGPNRNSSIVNLIFTNNADLNFTSFAALYLPTWKRCPWFYKMGQ